MPRACHDTGGIIAWHLGVGIAGRSGLYRLLHVDQAEVAAFPDPAINGNQHRIAQTPQRAATLHPIRRIHDLNVGVIVARLQRRDQPVNLVAFEQFLDRTLFILLERPEAFTKRNRGLAILKPLLRQMLP
jgi:hypothetical protein